MVFNHPDGGFVSGPVPAGVDFNSALQLERARERQRERERFRQRRLSDSFVRSYLAQAVCSTILCYLSMYLSRRMSSGVIAHFTAVHVAWL